MRSMSSRRRRARRSSSDRRSSPAKHRRWSAVSLSRPFLMTASPMRACACDTASQLYVRTVPRSAFSLVLPLRSTSSAAAEAALFARFSATSGSSDFSLAFIVGCGLRPSRRVPATVGGGTAMEISRFPGGRLLRMPGSTTTPGRLVSRDHDTDHLAFCWTAPRTRLTPLNIWPDALPYQRFACILTTARA